MKSSVFSITDTINTEAVLNQTSAFAKENNLQDKDVNTLRLLAEEMLSLVESLIKKTSGEFWLERTDDGIFELHLKAKTQSITMKQKEKLIDVSTDKKNLSARGFRGKLRAIFDAYLDESSFNSFSVATDALGNFTIMPILSMLEYQNNIKKDEADDWDGLEKSILEKLADDVLVGALNSGVELIVKKKFN